MCDLDLDLHPARARQTHDQRLISRTEARSAYVQAMGVSKYQTASQDQLGNFELLSSAQVGVQKISPGGRGLVLSRSTWQFLNF